jgi:hypothetical protein
MPCRPALALFGCALFAACSSDPVDSTPAAPAPSGTAPAPCKSGPGYREDVEPQRVDSLVAELVDLDGEPVADELVQVCGLDVCTNGKSGRDGRVLVTPAQNFREPAFKFGEGRESARFAALLPDEAEIDLGVVRTVRLPDVASSVPLVAGETASFAGFSLALASGTKIEIDGISFRTAQEKGLRVAQVPLAVAPDVVREGPDLELVYAATPVEARFCPPARLSVPNSEEWEPGTEVEVWLHGVDIGEEWAPYGGWGMVSAAVVSSDGQRLETTEPGLPVLGVLGFRRASTD